MSHRFYAKLSNIALCAPRVSSIVAKGTHVLECTHDNPRKWTCPGFVESV